MKFDGLTRTGMWLGIGWGVCAAYSMQRLLERSVLMLSRERRRQTRAAARPNGLHHARRRSVSWLVELSRKSLIGSAFRSVLSAFVRTRAERARARRVQHELPLAIDLIAVAIGAGSTPLQALVLSARWAPVAVGAHLREVVRRVELGVDLPDALSVLNDVAALRHLAEILAVAVRLGTPLQSPLQKLASDARAAHARDVAAIARTVPVRLIFPLVFLVLPAFALLTVVPALIAGWRGI